MKYKVIGDVHDNRATVLIEENGERRIRKPGSATVELAYKAFLSRLGEEGFLYIPGTVQVLSSNEKEYETAVVGQTPAVSPDEISMYYKRSKAGRMVSMQKIHSADEVNGSKIAVEAVLEMIRDGGSYPVRGSGFSMQPFIDEKDVLIVTSVEGRKIRVGDILLYERDNGKYVFHRVYKVDRDGTFSFAGDNQYRAEKGIRKEQLRAYVEKIIRNGREIDCAKWSVRIPMILYMWYRVKIPFISYRIRLLREKHRKIL